MSKSDWEVVETKALVKFYKGGRLYHKAHKEKGYSATFPSVIFQEPIKRKKKKTKKSNKITITLAAKQFARAFQKAQIRSTKNKNISLREDEADLIHFTKAADLADRHSVSYKKLIDAQVHGFKTMNDGNGHFPYLSQLHNANAETRLLEFINAGAPNAASLLTQEDKKLDLGDNIHYITRVAKTYDGFATLEEALYVKEMQKFHLGKCQKRILKSIKELRKNESK